jgi:archaellum component FlaC
MLKSEAGAIKEHLEQIDNRIRDLESEGEKEGE